MDDAGFLCFEHNLPLDELWQCTERTCRLAHCPQCGEQEFAYCAHQMASLGEEVYHLGFEMLLPEAEDVLAWWTWEQIVEAFGPAGEEWLAIFRFDLESDTVEQYQLLDFLMRRHTPPLVQVERETTSFHIGDAWTLWWLRDEDRTEVLYGILEDYAHISASLERLAAMPKLGTGPEPPFTPR